MNPARKHDTAGEDLSLVVVEEETALAEGLAAALVAQHGVARAAAVRDPNAAMSAVRRAEADVLIVGTDARGWDALTLLRSVTARYPEVAAVAVSGCEDPDRVTD